jgi:ferrochelatase
MRCLYDGHTMMHTSAVQPDHAPIGVLLTNLGSPEQPTPRALRTYLAEFLGDRRVIEMPRAFWLPLLHGVILNVRPRHSARLYAEVWTPQGSPLVVTLKRQAEALHAKLAARSGREDVRVVAAARYGRPSIREGLQQLRAAGVRRVLVFPLFPQYTAVTTATVFDVVFNELSRWRVVPELRTIRHYPDHPAYITTVAESIREGWVAHGIPERLLFSYHGIPQHYCQAGDPYEDECGRTSQLVAGRLGLPREAWQMGFQSQFGPGQWLGPATHSVLEAWGTERRKRVDVVCPGFSADCLETLHEVAHEYRERYEQAGGCGYRYVPALNVRADHVDALAQITLTHLQGWLMA